MGTLGLKSTTFLGSVETECLLASGLRGLSKLSQRRDLVEQDLLSLGVSGGVQQSVGHAPGIGLYESSQVVPLYCSDGKSSMLVVVLISDPKVSWAVVSINSGISFGSGSASTRTTNSTVRDQRSTTQRQELRTATRLPTPLSQPVLRTTEANHDPNFVPKRLMVSMFCLQKLH
jgi:hypothetical protein